MEPGHLTVSVRNMSAVEKLLASQCAQINFNNAASAALINIRNELGVNYSAEQMRYLTTKEQAEVGNLSHNASSAEKLVAAFKKQSDVAFLTVCYSPSEGLMLSMSKEQRKLKHDIFLKRSSYTEETLVNHPGFQDIYESNMSTGRLLLIFLFGSTEKL